MLSYRNHVAAFLLLQRFHQYNFKSSKKLLFRNIIVNVNDGFVEFFSGVNTGIFFLKIFNIDR